MSELTIRRVAILGAGTMGGALAAHLTNVGLSVTLLDVTLAAAFEGLERVRPLLYVPDRLAEIRALGFDEGDQAIEDADWIVEATREQVEVKRATLARVAPFIRPDAVLSTVGGSVPLELLVEGLPEAIGARFVSTHFTLPLAERRFVELRPGPRTDPTLISPMARFLTDVVALRVVRAEQGAGGIVARYGLWCLLFAAHVAEKLRLGVEDVDTIAGSFIGRPHGGIFGTIDLIGIDKLQDVATSLQERTTNAQVARFLTPPASLVSLLARGWTGDKVGQGFYRREGRERLALDLATMVYRQNRDSSLPGLIRQASLPLADRIREGLKGRDEVGEFLREFLVPSLRYAEALRNSSGTSPIDFDRTMKWGFGWDLGPFAMLDALGLGAVRYYDGDKVRNAEGGYDPIRSGSTPHEVKDYPKIDEGNGFSVHDLGDGVQAIALTETVFKASTVDALIVALSSPAFGRFVLSSTRKDFPALDISYVQACLRTGDTSAFDAYLSGFQILGELLESQSCVAAIQGSCLGPSLGLALSCPAIVATGDSQIGFDEAHLGLVPMARGLTLMRSLHGASTRRLSEVAVTLTEGKVTSTDLARQAGLLRPTDVTEFMPERLLDTAKRLVLDISPVPREPLPVGEGPLIGLIDRGLMDRKNRGALTDHDVAVGHRIRQVLARAGTYEESLERERQESIDLGAKALTLARIRHMVETGRQLRN